MNNAFRKLILQVQMNKKDLPYFALMVVIAMTGIFFRVWWINNVPTEQKYDFATYQAIAQNIFNGYGHTFEGSPIAWQGSGYSYALAFFYKIMGNTNEITGKYFNVILSTLTLGLSYFIYNKFFRKKLYVCIAFFITAFLPSLIAYNNALGTETFFLFLMACIVLIQQIYIKNIWLKYIVLGILCGLCTLTKPFMLAYPIILAVISWVDEKNLKQSLICCGTILLACIIVISPWTYRNYKLFGRFIPISYNAGYCLYINNNDTNVRGSWIDLQSVEASDAIKQEIEKSLENGNRSVKIAHELDPILNDEAKNWIFKNPGEFIKLGLLRIKSTFFDGANDIAQWTMNGIFNITPADDTRSLRDINTLQAFFDMTIYTLSGASFIFFFAKFKRYAKACFTIKNQIDPRTNIIFLNLAFFILVIFVFEGQARYIFPTLLFMISAAVAVIEGLSE